MWNMANVLLCKGIGLMGQAVGFPLCVGLGLISGSVTNYVITPSSTKPGMLALGDGIALAGICMVGFLAYRKDEELKAKQPLQDAEEQEGETKLDADVPLVRKSIICLVGGLLLGLSNIGVVNATNGSDALSPPTNQVFFSVGVFFSSAILIPLTVWYPVEGYAPSTTLSEIWSRYKDITAQDHLLSVLGGFTLCMGFFFYNEGNGSPVSAAAVYSIGQSAPVVGILWGTFFFREFKDTSAGVFSLVPVIVALFVGAIVSLAFSSK